MKRSFKLFFNVLLLFFGNFLLVLLSRILVFCIRVSKSQSFLIISILTKKNFTDTLSFKFRSVFQHLNSIVIYIIVNRILDLLLCVDWLLWSQCLLIRRLFFGWIERILFIFVFIYLYVRYTLTSSDLFRWLGFSFTCLFILFQRRILTLINNFASWIALWSLLIVYWYNWIDIIIEILVV
jgi:hypothetical protein